MRPSNAPTKREKFEDLRSAGQSIGHAAKAVGIAKSTGYAWSRLPRDTKLAAGATATPQFARLMRTKDVHPHPVIELEVAGVVVKVPLDFDADALARLVAVLRGQA